MHIYLAPMEGLVDPVMRDIISRIGGVDRCVTEFVRISERVLPRRVYLRLCPELRSQGQTRAATPVFVQLLGSDPQLLADTAAKLAELGAPGIDLNFGCPAKTVNRNRGGAILLKEPDLVGRIVEQVRAQLPIEIPLTAKMRLGYEDTSVALHNAVAIAEAGAGELCVHARTKLEGYRPPAHWHWLARIRQAVTIPVVANGEIWSLEDFERCRQVSGCQRVMLGRGLVSRPDLALQIRQHLDGQPVKALDWAALVPWIEDYYQQLHLIAPRYADGRLKQWLGLLRRNYAQAARLLQQLRRDSGEQAMRQGLAQSQQWIDDSGQAA
ncbi:tRNA dihydrouridine synthase [Motiliproteus sp.]|uniref:tRNA dihydrouridine synthase n=1 Tax=Motiliproteus sp. TaxID=1898955 RepID=UPI003BA8B375